MPTGLLDRLGPLGRLLLTSDGTLTPMLEHVVGERIVTAHLEQASVPADANTIALLSASETDILLFRAADLVGAESHRVYVRATSVVAVDAVPAGFRADLLGTEEPIGRLLRRHRIESFREILAWDVWNTVVPPDRDSGARRPVEASRRYLVHTGGMPALLIDETFASGCFPGP
jgi:beta-ribofuranosylaminobenzene 5'-phosphate synthase